MFGALFLALFVPAAMAVEPRVIQLRKIYSEYDASIPVPAWSTIYVASSDAEGLMMNISISIHGKNYTALELSQNYKTGYQKQGIFAFNDTTISVRTTNDDGWTNGLNGVIYIIPLEQTQDDNFFVYDSKSTQNINITEPNATTTLVFFNSRLNASMNFNQPIYNSMFSDFKFNMTPISFYTGYPPNSADVQETMFFSNPVKYLDSKNMSQSYMFNNIEPFQVSDDVFYIKIKGPISFTIKNAWDGMNASTTTAKTTTGLLSEFYLNYENRSIAFIANDQGSFGLNYMHKVYSNVNITLENARGQLLIIMPWTLNMEAGSFYSDVMYKKMYLAGYGSYEGQYYIQYFTIQGVEWTTVTPPPSTASSMAPGNTTMAPGNTTVAPGSTTMAPGNTTMAPGNTTVAPGNTTMAPTSGSVNLTTSIPPMNSTTTQMPESTTKSGGAFHLILATALTILFSQ